MLTAESQYNFQKRNYLTVQLLLCLNGVYELNDLQDGHEIEIMHVDFADALDTVPRGILVDKINSYDH